MSLKRKNAIILFLALFINGLNAQESSRLADSLRRHFGIPELAYAVIDIKGVVDLGISGQHSVLLHDTCSIDDRFHLGSNTKALTAFMIAKYVEMGKLKWDTKFFELFPKWLKNSNLKFKMITLKDLLSHRAGIQPFQGENDPEIPNFKGNRQQRRAQFGKFILTLERLKTDTNEPFHYSNGGYTLATLMLEKVSGKSWEQLVTQIFCQDLKLNVKFGWPENQKKKDTWGHLTQNDTLIPIASNLGTTLDFTEPAGDLNMSLGDYAKFIKMNLEGLNGVDGYLKSSTYQFLHNGVPNYSMGWFNVAENNQNFSSHTGTGAFTYYSVCQIDKQKLLAYIVFVNSYNDKTKQGVRILLRNLKSIQ